MKNLTIIALLFSILGCSSRPNLQKSDCSFQQGRACITLEQIDAGGASGSDTVRVQIHDPNGLGRQTVLDVSSSDDVKFKKTNRGIVIIVRGGLINNFRSYWFNPEILNHNPNGDVSIELIHYIL